MPPKKGKGKKNDDWNSDDDIVDPIKAGKKTAVDDVPAPVKSKSKSKKMASLKADLGLSDDDDAPPKPKEAEAAPSSKGAPKKKGKQKKGDDGWDSDKDVKPIDLKDVEEEEKPQPKSKSKNKTKNQKPAPPVEVEDVNSEEEIAALEEKTQELTLQQQEERDSSDSFYNSDEEKEKKPMSEEPELKLSHKDKKKLKKQMEYNKQMELMTKKGGDGHSELDDNFTVSQIQQSDKKLALLENAVDIKVENFSIAAKGKDLFVNASLLIAQGRRYGLVGPNGWVEKILYFHFWTKLLNVIIFSHGKTTLLRHIEKRILQIPPSIDVLLCEQEVVADDTTAVQVILKADIKRTRVMEEIEKLESKKKLDQVCVSFSECV